MNPNSMELNPIRRFLFVFFSSTIRATHSFLPSVSFSIHEEVMAPIKIIIIGPQGCGKSTIANFISDTTTSLQSEDKYKPTYATRILEKDNVEFWDCSGDQSFEGCWRSIMTGADGVLIVFNPDIPGQEQQLSEWVIFI